MRRDVAALRNGEFDLLIVGGGINGAGAARDAAMRGLRVALVEKGDFASGTSSRSSKLVHGGVRYLEQLDFSLVLQASRERRILQAIAPHLVRPLPFLIPIYRGDRRNPALIRLGMWLYDLLALLGNTRHRMLAPEEALRREPTMRADGLRAAALYYDAQMDDARLCLANVVSAVEHGAVCLNYVELLQVEAQDGQVVGARVRDHLTGDTFHVRARGLLNAAGPWLDQVRGRTPGSGAARPTVRLTKGAHCFVPALTRSHAITIPSSDGRVVFVIPWGEMSLVGTTDTDFDGDPDHVQPTADEIAYLLREVQRIIPGHDLTPAAVISAYAGVRSLVWQEGVSEAQVTREHHIEVGPSGIVSLAGGKYTTYRDVARQLVDHFSPAPCRTHRQSLPGGDVADFATYLPQQARALAARYGLSPAAAERLVCAYGTRAERVLQEAESNDELAARTLYAVRHEQAVTLADVLRRRTQIAFGRGRGLLQAGPVSHLTAPLLGWDEPERQRQVAMFAREMGIASNAPSSLTRQWLAAGRRHVTFVGPEEMDGSDADSLRR